MATSSHVLGADNKAKQRASLLGNVEVLKNLRQNLVVHGNSEGRQDVRVVVVKSD